MWRLPETPAPRFGDVACRSWNVVFSLVPPKNMQTILRTPKNQVNGTENDFMDLRDLPSLFFAPTVCSLGVEPGHLIEPGLASSSRNVGLAPKMIASSMMSLFNMTSAYESKQHETTRMILHGFGLPILECFGAPRHLPCVRGRCGGQHVEAPEMTSTRGVPQPHPICTASSGPSSGLHHSWET